MSLGPPNRHECELWDSHLNLGVSRETKTLKSARTRMTIGG
jgi:hypothetical protein